MGKYKCGDRILMKDLSTYYKDKCTTAVTHQLDFHTSSEETGRKNI